MKPRNSTTVTTYSKELIPDGTPVVCMIHGHRITDAKAVIHKNKLYILQNQRDGSQPPLGARKYGYRYGWVTNVKYKEGNDGITELYINSTYMMDALEIF